MHLLISHGDEGKAKKTVKTYGQESEKERISATLLLGKTAFAAVKVITDINR